MTTGNAVNSSFCNYQVDNPLRLLLSTVSLQFQ